MAEAPNPIAMAKLPTELLIASEEPLVYHAVEFLDLLPSLKQICMKDVDLLLPKDGPVQLPMTALKSIAMSNCGIATKSLQIILARQRLECFRYLSASELPIPTTAASFSAEDIANHLASSRSSLNALTLFPDITISRPNMRAFKHLSYLEVLLIGFLQINRGEDDAEVIANIILSMIPHSLQTLHFSFLRDNEDLKRILHLIVALKTRGEYSYL